MLRMIGLFILVLGGRCALGEIVELKAPDWATAYTFSKIMLFLWLMRVGFRLTTSGPEATQPV